MKKIFIIIFIIKSIFIYSDLTSDKIIEKRIYKDKRGNIESSLKYRGHIKFVLTYYPAIHDGVNPGDHFGKIDYNSLDYTDNGDPDNEHHNGKGRILNYTGFEIKLYYQHDIIVPLLKGDHFLFSGNNITFSFLGEISPVSTNIGFEVTWLPIAFLYLQSGVLIGSGWNFLNLAAGLGLNGDDGILKFDYFGTHFQFWFSATFQMDLAYIMPKNIQRWMHIVMFVKPKLKYQSLFGINNDQSYMYEADRGENLNGWRFSSEFFLGYQFNIIEDYTGSDRTYIKMINKRLSLILGFLANIEKIDLTNFKLSPMTSNDGWGSDFIVVEFGPLIKLDLPNNYWLVLFTFFANDKAYTEDTVGNAFYQNRIYEDWYIHFRRFGIFTGWDF